MAAPSNAPSLPHSIETYHGKTTEINHEKTIRSQNDTITQQFRVKIEIIDGKMLLLIQKDGQRRNTAKKESEIKKLTSDVIKQILIWMDFDITKFAKMKKPQLVEFICALFQIPTTATLNINDTDANQIIEYLIKIIEEEPVIDDLTYYIENKQANMIIIGDIIELCLENEICLYDYFSKLWLGLIDNFQTNRNDDLDYRKGFDSITESNEIINLQTQLSDSISIVLTEYNVNNNKSIEQFVFWYSFDLLIFRYFNYSVKQYIVATYVESPSNTNSPMNKQRECAIHKYFGSAFCGWVKTIKGNNYGEEKREILLHIINKCLLQYDFEDFQHGKNNIDPNSNQEIKNPAYHKVPLRLRLQNSGHLVLINEPFYQNVAIEMYSRIANDLQRVFMCYDPKKVQEIEQKMRDHEELYSNFDKITGSIEIDHDPETNYKAIVWKGLVHRVTSRIVVSLHRRHTVNKNHVGDFRTGVKALNRKK